MPGRRPVMDQYLGRQIRGVVHSSGISWDFTRAFGAWEFDRRYKTDTALIISIDA
jgi:hypothetical protein